MNENQIIDMGHQQGELYLTNEAREGLKTAANWSMFIAIIGFIFAGIMLLAGLGMLFMSSVMGSSMPGNFPFPIWIFTLVYIGFSVLYFLPMLYLYQFASKTKHALFHNDVQALTVACANIGKHYKFLGIMVIVMMVLYVVFIIVMAGMGMSMARNGMQ